MRQINGMYKYGNLSYTMRFYTLYLYLVWLLGPDVENDNLAPPQDIERL